MFKVISYVFVCDGVFNVFYNEVSCFVLVYVVQYYFIGKDNRVWVDFVQASVFWCSIVGCFEDCMFCSIIDICIWCNFDIINLCSKGIRNVVFIEIKCCNN